MTAKPKTGVENLPAPVATASSLALVHPVARPFELIELHKEVAVLIQDSLTEGVDYGVIPGTGDKPVLLKPGAERLCLAFGASAQYVLVTAEIDHDREVAWSKKKKVWTNGRSNFEVVDGRSQGLYRYVYKARIVRHDGRVLGEGEGVCSTMESKYVDRPRDCENTALKMAQKRALVAAVLNAFGLSNRFTQDVEEFADRDEALAEPRRDDRPPPQQRTAPASTQAQQRAAPAQRPTPAADAPPPAAEGRKASIYEGTPTQAGIIRKILETKKVPPQHWEDINDKLLGRPSTDLTAIIKEVWAG